MSSNQIASAGPGANTDRNRVATSFFRFRVPRLRLGISPPCRRGVPSSRPPSSQDQSGRFAGATFPHFKILLPGEQASYMVTIPGGVEGGQQFPVTIGSQHLLVTCPNLARPGMRVRITPPAPPALAESAAISVSGGRATCRVPVPNNVRPGECFEIYARGKRVRVRRPSTSKPGQILQIAFPIDENESPARSPNIPPNDIKLDYSRGGWVRTIRGSDMKFQWKRIDQNAGPIENTSAYVLKVDFLHDDIQARQGLLSLVASDEGIVDSTITNSYGQEVVGYSDIARIQAGSFRDKIQLFQEVCATKLAVDAVDWRRYLRINVRRQHLLSDLMEAVMSLSQKDLTKRWRIEFIGEPGIDDGGYSRDWSELVTEQIFDPDLGLWRRNAKNQKCMEINPASEAACTRGDHLVYFRFLGRMMGRALFCREFIKGRMVEHLYKFILGWPITVNDLKLINEKCYHCLNGLEDIVKGLEKLNMTFDLMHEVLGFVVGPCGAHASLAEGSLEEYTKAVLDYHLLGECESQLAALLSGIYDVVPAPLLAAFDYFELEQLLCGLNEAETSGSWSSYCVD